MNLNPSNHRFKLGKNEVSKTNLGIDTFRYPISIPFPGIDTFRYLISIPSSGINTF